MENESFKKTSEAPSFSLIIPAFNEEKYIGECLASVQKNANGFFKEVIVVDNASSDKTTERALSYPFVRVEKEERLGVTRARERGFRTASGDILVFIDADTKIPNNWTATLSREFANNPKIVLLSGPCFYDDIPILQKFFVSFYWYALAYPVYLLVGAMAAAGNMAIRRSVLEKMKGFDTNIDFYGDDTDTVRRASRFGKVKFSLRWTILTSGRRLSAQGIVSAAREYARNYFSQIFWKKSSTKEHRNIR